MSECSCIPRHRAWARPWARTARTSQECSGWRDMEKTSRLPRCGFSYPQPQNGGLPEEIWKTPQRAKRDLIYKFFFFSPKNSEPDILQGMTRHFESSSLRKFASVFSFAACPSPRWYPHCGEGPGMSEPSQFDQTADRLLVCVRDGNVGGNGLKRQVWKDTGARRDKTTRAVKGWAGMTWRVDLESTQKPEVKAGSGFRSPVVRWSFH